MPLSYASHFVLTSFSDALVTLLATKVRDDHYNHCKAQGQNNRVRVQRTVFLTLAKISDLLVFFHQVCKKFHSLSRLSCLNFSAALFARFVGSLMRMQYPKPWYIGLESFSKQILYFWSQFCIYMYQSLSRLSCLQYLSPNLFFRFVGLLMRI